MSDESVFTPDPAGEESKPAAIVLPDSVKDMIGEGKKYATVEKALEALGHSQSHIAKIEQENRELRERGEPSGITQEDVLRTVQELLEAERAKTRGAVAQVDEAAVAGLVDRTLTQREQAILKQANRVVVEKALKEKYADKAKEHLQSVASELGVGVDFLASMSESSPEAAMKLLGLSKQPVVTATTSHGSVSASALRSNKPLTPPAKSVMRGATTAEIVAELKRHHPDNKQME